MSKRTYNRDNCDNRLRAIITDKLGRKILLFGKHAYEYEIVIEKDNKIIVNTFKSGREARKEFNNYKKKR